MSGCGRKAALGNKKLAQNYFKSALVELSDQQVGIYHYKKALSYVEQAIKQDSKANYVALQATLLFKLGQEQESLHAYEQALACCEDVYIKSEIINNYACLLAQMGQSDKAIESWEKLCIDRYYLTPEVALVNLGKTYAESGNYHVAQSYFQRAVALAPHYLDAHFYLAWTAYFNKNEVLAKQEVATLLYLDPQCDAINSLRQKLGLVI